MLKIEESYSQWKDLYVIGAIASLLAALIFRKNWSAEVSLLRILGIINDSSLDMPIKIVDWFNLIQENLLIGIIYLNFFDLINYFLVGLTFLALYQLLNKFNRSYAFIAVIFGFIGITLLFASNQCFSIINLSNHYASTTTETEKAAIIAAGEALLAIGSPGTPLQGTAGYLSGFLVAIAGFIFSGIMLKSKIFNKLTASCGIIAFTCLLSTFIPLILNPTFVFIPISTGAPFLLIWHLLIGIKLLKLNKHIKNIEP